MKRSLQLNCLAVLLASVCTSAALANDIASAALDQVGVTVHYDPSYRKLVFPEGDVPRERGVCTDVVIRALRDARGIDLQRGIIGHYRLPM